MPEMKPLAARRCRHGESGLSLLEVTIATLMLTVVTMMSMTALVTTSVADREIRDRSVALRAALSQIEHVASIDYGSDLNNLALTLAQPDERSFTVDRLPAPPAMSAAGVAGGNSERPHGSVTCTMDGPFRAIVRVTVNWSSHDGVARTLFLSTVYAKVDP